MVCGYRRRMSGKVKPALRCPRRLTLSVPFARFELGPAFEIKDILPQSVPSARLVRQGTARRTLPIAGVRLRLRRNLFTRLIALARMFVVFHGDGSTQ